MPARFVVCPCLVLKLSLIRYPTSQPRLSSVPPLALGLKVVALGASGKVGTVSRCMQYAYYVLRQTKLIVRRLIRAANPLFLTAVPPHHGSSPSQ